MTLVKWRPMLDPFSEFDKFFEEWNGTQQGFVPALDVYQDKEHVVVETQLPGVNPENVTISIENDVLTIEGKAEKKSEVDEKNYYRKEIRSGSFHRAVALPTSVAGEKASAEYTGGVLKITIPKEERAKPKQIKIATT